MESQHTATQSPVGAVPGASLAFCRAGRRVAHRRVCPGDVVYGFLTFPPWAALRAARAVMRFRPARFFLARDSVHADRLAAPRAARSGNRVI